MNSAYNFDGRMIEKNSKICKQAAVAVNPKKKYVNPCSDPRDASCKPLLANRAKIWTTQTTTPAAPIPACTDWEVIAEGMSPAISK
eukprot:3742318-Amphidinium_carterae.1